MSSTPSERVLYSTASDQQRATGSSSTRLAQMVRALVVTKLDCRKYLFYKFHINRLTDAVANGDRHSLPASLHASYSVILNIHAARARP